MSSPGVSHGFLNPLLNAIFGPGVPGLAADGHPVSARLRDLRRNVAANSTYTFLVPKTAILEWCVDVESMLPLRDLCYHDDFWSSHVIQVSQQLRNVQRTRYVGTFNDRVVIVKDGAIYTHRGFKTLVKATILSEYMFYPAVPFLPPDAQFLVYEIDVPLVGVPAPSVEVSPTVSSRYQLLAPVKQIQRKLSTSSQKGPLPPTNGYTALPNTDNYSRANGHTQESPTLANCRDLESLLPANGTSNRQILAPLLTLLEPFNCSEAATEDDVLSAFDQVIESAMEIFRSDKDIVQSISRNTDLTGEDITDSIYGFVETYLSEEIWSQLCHLRAGPDEQLAQAIAALQNVDVGQIGLPDDLGLAELMELDKKVWKATAELQQLVKVSTADEKVEIILSVVHILSSSGYSGSDSDTLSDDNYEPKKQTTVNADVLVSLLLLAVCRSGLTHLETDIYYVRNFTYHDSESGHLGYALLTLEGVLYHINNESGKLAALSKMNKELWDTVASVKDETDLAAHTSQLQKQTPDWVSVMRSRSALGESSLTLAVQRSRAKLLSCLLDLGCDVYPKEYFFSDSTEEGKSLLLSAAEMEDVPTIRLLLDYVLNTFDKAEQMSYFARYDKWNRCIGHYFFHAPWLIREIGHLISWEQRDQNGQTPLFALCRSYDHLDYNVLLDDGFKAWNIDVAKTGGEPSIMDHIDAKGNTILHIVKDKQAADHVMKCDVDVNWPNDKGLTPLMVYSKYSRLSAIARLTSDERIDLSYTDNRGLNALDMAKESQTLTLLDEIVTFSLKPSNGRVTTVQRSIFANGEIYFIIKSGEPPRSSSLSTIRRTMADFLFLQKWLAYENPHSWIPHLKPRRNAFSVAPKASRQIIHETEQQLDWFLRTLMLHPTFMSHELLWEFILVQDISQQQCIDRSRRKLESRRELQYEDVTVYGIAELESTEVFLLHARQETDVLASRLSRLVQVIMRLRNKTFDYNEAMAIFESKFREVSFLQPLSKVAMGKDFMLAKSIKPQALTTFGLDTIGASDSAMAMLTALTTPLGLIEQVREQDTVLAQNQTTLIKLTGRTGWMSGMFEEKRGRETRGIQDRIYATQNEIHRLSAEIKFSHITLASELGGFHDVQAEELTRTIEMYAATMIRREKERFDRLRRLTAKVKKMP